MLQTRKNYFIITRAMGHLEWSSGLPSTSERYWDDPPWKYPKISIKECKLLYFKQEGGTVTQRSTPLFDPLQAHPPLQDKDPSNQQSNKELNWFIRVLRRVSSKRVRARVRVIFELGFKVLLLLLCRRTRHWPHLVLVKINLDYSLRI
jgi:hypothetical protein